MRLLLAVTVLTAFAIVACKKEYSYEGGFVNSNCINCTYLPVCDSSVFTYLNTSGSTVDTTTNVVFILGDTSVNGKKYVGISPLAAFTEGLWYNCDNQQYKLLFSLSSIGLDLDSLVNDFLQTIQLPIPLPPGAIPVPEKVILTILKANESQGAMWTDTIMNVGFPTFNIFGGFDHKLLEKNVQRTILQKTYSNVMHVQSQARVSVTGMAFPVDFSVDFYLAKDVGVVEIEVKNGSQVLGNSKLLSYKLK